LIDSLPEGGAVHLFPRLELHLLRSVRNPGKAELQKEPCTEPQPGADAAGRPSPTHRLQKLPVQIPLEERVVIKREKSDIFS